MSPNELWTCSRDGTTMAQTHGFNVTVVVPFEEEEEGTGIGSEVPQV